jgi:hypothetical protein
MQIKLICSVVSHIVMMNLAGDLSLYQHTHEFMKNSAKQAR